MSLIARLIEAGAPADIIEEVAMLVAEKRALDARRENERERKRRSRDVTGQDVTARTETAQKKIPPHPPKENTTPVSPKGDTAPKGVVRKGFRIPEDWEPPAVAELGPKFSNLARQWTRASYETEAAAFQAYWSAETGAKASKSNWKRAWENRVAQIHSKVMRDQKFGNAPVEVPSGPAAKPRTPAELAEFYRKIGRDDEAEEIERREAKRTRSTGPPRPIGEVLRAANEGR